jgi:hypothetical protein
MLEPENIRAQARDYAAQATAAGDLHEAVRLRQLAKSYLLLEKNARWLLSTDEFLDALRANRRWPRPGAAAEHRSLPGASSGDSPT